VSAELDKLPQMEELILRAIAGRELYGLEIVSAFLECLDYELSVGTLYPTLDRLEKKGLIAQWWGDEEDGSARRKYSRLTPLGENALRIIDERLSRLKVWRNN
jgi:PadR family transcriptional regulator, regulatory protein PadR